MITRGIREFVARDWTAVRESKNAYWAARVARLGPIERLRIADELCRQMLLQHPERHEIPADRSATSFATRRRSTVRAIATAWGDERRRSVMTAPK